MNTKAILKFLKLNESTISTILGALVIVVLGFIVINYFRNQNTGQLQPGTSTESTEQPIIQRGQGPVDYTIGEGESLWSIAQKQYGSGYNWVDIAEANKLTSPDDIAAGQTISIPDVAPRLGTDETVAPVAIETTEPKPTTIAVATPAPTPVMQKGEEIGSNYVVQTGDSLWEIAVRAYGDGNQWVKIATANKLDNPNIIHQGNNLTIPR